VDAPAPVDPATIPTLSGVFAPVHEEHDVVALPVRGEIPADLRGAYLRNGPNPWFPPLGSYTFPLEGDAMLHGIWIDDDGSARYRNRVVWTPQLRLEQQAGHALWAGLMTPYLPGPDVVPAEYAGDFKPAPFINIVHHGGRWLAMSEVDPPWEVDAGLEVVGTAPFTWDGVVPGMCAHPRIDPETGEMVFFRYDLEPPYLTWGSIAADGTVAHAPDVVELEASYMIHDFVLTPHHVVLFVAPAKFDLDALLTGAGPPLAWHPDEPVRIAVIPRDGTAADARWIETEAFWAYHFANGFEDAGDIVVDFSRFSHFALGKSDQTGAVTRARIDLGAGAVTLDSFDDRLTEFPRIDDRLQTRPHRFFTVSAKTPGRPMGEFNVVVRVDTATGISSEWDSGSKVFDEVVFARAEGGPPEQGYYVTFRTDLETLRSDWVVLDAADVAAGPVATVELPFRVPSGLHGNWFSASST
jgi:carotenoid cleavage dioxygenase-like enzyme